MFRCSRALTNPRKSLGQSSTLIAIILAGSLLIWFVLYDFNVSFKAQKCSWCFYLHRLLAHISRKCFYVYIITDIHSDFCMDVNFANLCFCCYDIKAIFRNFSTHSWWKSLSYRNQTIDLLCKSVDWFLYDRNLRHDRVKCLSLTFLRKFIWDLKGACSKTLVLLKLQRYIDIAL